MFASRGCVYYTSARVLEAGNVASNSISASLSAKRIERDGKINGFHITLITKGEIQQRGIDAEDVIKGLEVEDDW
jgi:hypothetical protein